MHRRHAFALALGAAAGLGTVGLAGAAAAAQATGRAAANAAPGTPWDRLWLRFRDRLENGGTGPRLTWFLRGQLGGEETMLAALRRNRVQIGGHTLQGLSSVIPELGVLLLPYLFDSREELDFIYGQVLAEPLSALFRARGLELLQWTEVGWTNLYADRPVRRPADVAGVKLRGSPNPAAQGFLRAVGADAVPLSTSDLLPALQTGLVQGGLSGVVYHWFVTRTFASDFTLTEHSYDTGAIVANADWFAAAAPGQQQAMRAALGPPSELRDEVRALEATLIEKLATSGTRVHRLTTEERTAWVTAARPVHAPLVNAIGGKAQSLYDLIIQGKARFAAERPRQDGGSGL